MKCDHGCQQNVVGESIPSDVVRRLVAIKTCLPRNFSVRRANSFEMPFAIVLCTTLAFFIILPEETISLVEERYFASMNRIR